MTAKEEIEAEYKLDGNWRMVKLADWLAEVIAKRHDDGIGHSVYYIILYKGELICIWATQLREDYKQRKFTQLMEVRSPSKGFTYKQWVNMAIIWSQVLDSAKEGVYESMAKYGGL